MPLTKQLLRDVRRLDQYDLRRLMIIARGLLIERGSWVPDEGDGSSVTYRQQHVRCGKESCTSCPHGPYWYAYWREDGKQRSRYIGKELPEGSDGT